jgi:phosphoribosyl 1,2-cyclic phosphodiesterase
MKVAALSSGSGGNCFYVEKDSNAILIDAGISAKRINERLTSLKLNADKIKALFITHEHIDHIRGADVFSRQFDIPIYATKGTINSGFLCSNEDMINTIKNKETVNIAGFSVEAFQKFHKAADPVSFSIFNNDRTVSVVTDIGFPCENVNRAIENSNFIFLESNHDIEMLKNGPYPHFLKNWIGGDSGHLSNKQASLAVLEYGNSKLKNVVLSHLSKVNNEPRVALKTFNSLLKERKNFSANVTLSLENASTPLFKL